MNKQDETKSLQAIRSRLRRNGYHGLVEGVSTFDTAQLFEDLRAVVSIVTGQAEITDDLARLQASVRATTITASRWI